MKKVIKTIALCGIVFFAASCSSSSSPAEESVKLIEKFTEQIQSASSLEQIQQYSDEFQEKWAAFEEKNKEYKPTEEEQEKIATALGKLFTASQQKGAELAGN